MFSKFLPELDQGRYTVCTPINVVPGKRTRPVASIHVVVFLPVD